MLFRLLGPVVLDRFSSAMCRTCPPHAPRVSLGCRIASCLQCGFFLAAIRDCFAPIGPCSGCSLFRCSHLPPGRACFTWVCALHPNDDGSLQASAAPPSGFICVGSARPDSFLRGAMLPRFLFSCIYISSGQCRLPGLIDGSLHFHAIHEGDHYRLLIAWKFPEDSQHFCCFLFIDVRLDVLSVQ